MMSVSAISTSSGASSYYEKDDYYTHESPPSEWQGKGAEALHLSGEVKPDAFQRILEGKLPDGTELGTMRNGELAHKPGWDLTFSAPKSVSIMAEVGKDERLIAAHDQAVRAALEHVEREASNTRIREHGQVRLENTGNMTIATFRHDMSREQDPQLHTHSVVMNATKSEDGQWRSMESKDIYRIQKEAGLIYREELAANVRGAGYEIENAKAGRDWSFEIKGVGEEARAVFSTRAAQVEQGLEKIGKNRATATAKEKEIAALDSRKAKSEGIDREVVREGWKEEASQAGLDVDQLRQDAEARLADPDHQRNQSEQSQIAANNGVTQAVEHLGERSTIFSKKDLEKEAFRFANGQASREQISNVIVGKVFNRELLDRHAYDHRTRGEVEGFTTQKALDIERLNVSMEYRGRGKFDSATAPTRMDKIRGISEEKKADKIVANAEKNSAKLGHTWTADQRAATKGLLLNHSRVVAIQGAAGTAKTSTVVRTYAAEIEKKGGKVVGMAPTNSAASELKTGGGIKYTKSIARHLADLKKTEREIGQLQRQAKGHEFKAKQQAFKAKNPINSKAVSITKSGVVLNKSILGKWQRSHGMDALAIKAAASTKSAYHKVRANSQKNQAAEKNNQATAKNDGIKHQTWVVDEASMIGNKQMGELLQAAEKYDARIILVGDTQQISSVTAGRAFQQMQKHGMETFKLEDIVRQKDGQLKDAVVEAYKGKAAEAIEKIDKIGGIEEIKNPKNNREEGVVARAGAIAKDYISLSKEDRGKTIIIAPGHDDRAVINQAVRDEMKQEGTLFGQSVEAKALINKSLTEAEKKSAQGYEKGDVVRFGRDNQKMGIEKGAYLKVSGKQGDVLTLQKASGEKIKWNPAGHGSGAGRTETFTSANREYQKGDKVIFTRNNKDLGINNKSTGRVERVKGNKMTVRTDSGQSVKLDMAKPESNHIDHGYAITAHAAQGSTADRALIHSESQRVNLTNQRSIYVAISRAKGEVKIYTDNKKKLKSAVADRSGEKSAASDKADSRLSQTSGSTKQDKTSQNTKAPDQGAEKAPEKGGGMER